MAAETPPPDPEERHITFREFKTELKSFRNETRVLIVGLLVVLRFDVPKEITAAAIAGILAKALWTAVTIGRFH